MMMLSSQKPWLDALDPSGLSGAIISFGFNTKRSRGTTANISLLTELLSWTVAFYKYVALTALSGCEIMMPILFAGAARLSNPQRASILSC
jgi:hypothetical protein